MVFLLQGLDTKHAVHLANVLRYNNQVIGDDKAQTTALMLMLDAQIPSTLNTVPSLECLKSVSAIAASESLTLSRYPHHYLR